MQLVLETYPLLRKNFPPVLSHIILSGPVCLNFRIYRICKSVTYSIEVWLLFIHLSLPPDCELCEGGRLAQLVLVFTSLSTGHGTSYASDKYLFK